MPSALAAQSLHLYGASTSGRYGDPSRDASSSCLISRSSKNFKNIIQVKSGRRSTSPFRPLSLRSICRTDFMRAERSWEFDFERIGSFLGRDIKLLLIDTALLAVLGQLHASHEVHRSGDRQSRLECRKSGMVRL